MFDNTKVSPKPWICNKSWVCYPAGASFAERRSCTAGGRERGIDPRGEIKLCLEDIVIVVQFNSKIWENPHPNSCTSNIIHLYHLQTKPVSLYSFSKVRNENRPVQPKKHRINGEVQITYVQKDSFSRWWFQPPILRQQQRRIQPNDLFIIFTTPPKTNMEPEITSLEKEKPLQTANFGVPCLLSV